MGPHVCDRKEVGGPRPDFPVMLASQVNRHKYASHSLNFTFRVQENGRQFIVAWPRFIPGCQPLKVLRFRGVLPLRLTLAIPVHHRVLQVLSARRRPGNGVGTSGDGGKDALARFAT